MYVVKNEVLVLVLGSQVLVLVLVFGTQVLVLVLVLEGSVLVLVLVLVGLVGSLSLSLSLHVQSLLTSLYIVQSINQSIIYWPTAQEKSIGKHTITYIYQYVTYPFKINDARFVH